MLPALVSAGPVLVPSSTTVRPRFGQPTIPGNLLVAIIHSGNTPGTTVNDAAWKLAVEIQIVGGTVSIWYKPNSNGNDLNPTFTTASNLSAGQLFEYSGIVTVNPLDQVASANTALSSVTATMPFRDKLPGSLLVSGIMWQSSPADASASFLDKFSSNVGSTLVGSAEDGTHVIFWRHNYGITLNNAIPDSDTATEYTQSVPSVASLVLASFTPVDTTPPYSYGLESSSDRLVNEDGVGVLVLETATPMFRAFLTEDARGYIYLEDGSGVLLGDPGLLYAISQESQTVAGGSIALVGSAGTYLRQTSGGSSPISPAFGQATTAGNLLVACISQRNGTPATVSGATGWQKGPSMYYTITNQIEVTIWFKPNCAAGETAPTFNAPGGATYFSAQLIEFSGADLYAPLDKSNAVVSTLDTALTFGNLAPDAASGDVVITAVLHTGSSTTATFTDTYGSNATSINLGNDGNIVALQHSDFAYAITTGNSVADSDVNSGAQGGGFTINYNGVIASFRKKITSNNSADRFITEDGTGVLLSEEFDTQPIFRNYQLEEATQKFYLHDATSTDTGTLPGGSSVMVSPSPTVTASGASVNRAMDKTIGTSQVSQSVVVTNTDTEAWVRRFLSPPLATQVIPGGGWTFSYGYSSTQPTGNDFPTLDIGLWRPSTGQLIQRFAGMAGGPPATTAEEAQNPATAASAIPVLEGDVLVIEFAISSGQIITATDAFYYDGITEGSATSNAAYLLAPAPIALANITDKLLMEDSNPLISEEPSQSLGTLFTQAITGIVSFTGAALKNAIGTRLTAGLSFTGAALQKAVTKRITTGTLSFTGPTNLLKATTKNLIVGVLSFTGSSAQKIIFNVILAAASLTFTGPTNLLLSVGKRAAGTLSFTGPTNLLKAITKNITGGVSFTGPTNLLKATTKTLAAATLSFTGNIVKQTRTNLVVAQLSFSGAIATARAFLKSLPGVLTFTGPTNLLKAVSKNLTVGSLSFTGPTNLLKAITKNLTVGALSFTGAALRKAISVSLTAAVLSFTGPTNLLKSTSKRITTGVLSFTGTIASNKAFIWAMTAALTFTGPTNLLKNITKSLTVAGLSFTGTTIKSTAKQAFTGVLSFTGAIVKLPKKALTATLTFTGAHTFNNVFIRALAAATLSFTGAITKKTSKSLVTAVLSFTGPTNLLKSIGKVVTGGLSFTGALLRAIKVSLTTGALSFTGTLNKKTSKFLVTATLSFTGAFTRAIIFLKILVTAVLSFTGPTNLLKSVGKNVTGGLSFTGPTNLRLAITKGISGGVSFVGSTIKKTSKFITGTLSFTGGFVAAIPSHFTDFILAAANLTFTGAKSVVVGKKVTGTLSFAGTIRKDITKKLTVAVLSFTGVTLRAFPRSLTATLTFTGSVTKQTGKRLNGVLSFTGPTNLKKAIAKAVRSTLTFFGNLSFPGKFGLAKVGVQLDSIPMVIEMAVAETLPFVVDVSNYLQAGDTVGATYASLINASTGAPVTVLWRNAITVSGNFMTIPILGSTLRLGQTYQMTIVFVASATKYATFITYIKVVA